ncbi:MAG: hypothetical protein ACI4RT_09620 [Candidatus Spyradenecus sp.]
MAEPMEVVVTNAGIAAIVNAEHTGTAPVKVTSVGLGTGQYTAAATQTALQAEFKRLTAVAGGNVGNGVLHITANDADTSGEYPEYTVYEVGIYVTNETTGVETLFGVYSSTSPIVQKARLSEIMLAVDILLVNINPESVTVGETSFVLSPATVDRAGIIEIATTAETLEGRDSARAVTPQGLAQLTATTERKGLVELANFAEVLAGTDETRAITPSVFKAAFPSQKTETGFTKLPNGVIVQWGKALIANGTGGTTVTFPTAFPTACRSVSAVSTGAVAIDYNIGALTAGNVTLTHNGNGGVTTYWLAVGY